MFRHRQKIPKRRRTNVRSKNVVTPRKPVPMAEMDPGFPHGTSPWAEARGMARTDGLRCIVRMNLSTKQNRPVRTVNRHNLACDWLIAIRKLIGATGSTFATL